MNSRMNEQFYYSNGGSPFYEDVNEIRLHHDFYCRDMFVFILAFLVA